MSATNNPKQGKKTRKYGRNRAKCAAYAVKHRQAGKHHDHNGHRAHPLIVTGT